MSEQGDLPGTKTLDYIALGFILVPPAVLVEIYMKSETIDWRKAVISVIFCWVGGAVFVWASHGWQSWRTSQSSKFFAEIDNKISVRASIIGCAVAGALFLSSILSEGGSDVTKIIASVRAERDAALFDVTAAKQRSEILQATINEMIKRPSDRSSNGAAAPAPVQPNRTILAVGPQYFFDLAQGKYGNARDEVIKPYIGKWMKVTAIFERIESESPSNILKVDARPDVNDHYIDDLFMTFDRTYENRIILFKRGDEFTATCKIDSLDGGMAFNLSQCEL